MAGRLLRRVWVQGYVTGNFKAAAASGLAKLVESLLKVRPAKQQGDMAGGKGKSLK